MLRRQREIRIIKIEELGGRQGSDLPLGDYR